MIDVVRCLLSFEFKLLAQLGNSFLWQTQRIRNAKVKLGISNTHRLKKRVYFSAAFEQILPTRTTSS